MSLRANLLFTTALTTAGAFWVASPTGAADATPDAMAGPAPAVSGPNLKFDVFGGHEDAESTVISYDERLYGASGSFTAPMGDRFGFQIDAMTGTFGGDHFQIVAGHLFWRDPAIGLAGIYASRTEFDRGPWTFIDVGSGVEATRVAFEGEVYQGNITLRGLVGHEDGDIDGGAFANVDLNWYATPDAKLSIGYRHSDGGEGAVAVGGEWLMPGAWGSGRSSLFAEGRFGDDNNNAVWGGLRVYFGQSQTLIAKHRYDDPEGPEPDLFGVQALVGELDQKNEDAKCALTSCTIR